MKSNVYSNRVKATETLLRSWGADALLIENPIDVFYLTALEMSAGTLVVKPKKTTLFVDGRYLAVAQKKSPFPVASIHELRSSLTGTVVIDSQTTTIQRWDQLKSWIEKKSFTIKPVPSPLHTIRAVKEKDELKKLKMSAQLLWKGFIHLKRRLKVGVTERQAALDFELFCRKQGASGMSFSPIVAFGKNTAYPHYRAGEAKLKKGDIVLCDLGVVLDHYSSDMTRTFFFGKADPRLILLDSVVKKAHGAALKICKPGTTVGALDKVATEQIRDAGLEQWMAHSLGHGIGLETHEFPRIKQNGSDHSVVLQEGMVITIEPGLYMPGVGGVRHEDTVVVTSKGFENFYGN